MSPDTAKKILTASFIAAIATMTWDELKRQGRTPKPARYVGAGVIWGILGALYPLAPPFFAVFGIGMYLTLLWQWFNPTQGIRFLSDGRATGGGTNLPEPDTDVTPRNS